MFEDIISFLKNKDIKFDAGLEEEEFKKIEKIYNFNFPYSLRMFLSQALPVSSGFYNWRDLSSINVLKIKNMMNYFFEYINNAPCNEYMPNDSYWVNKWGKMPKDLCERKSIILKEYNKAPKIIPVFMHRFIPIIDDKNPPILSIHYTDIIYYARNLSEYFMIEFGLKRPNVNINQYRYIPFWTDLIEAF